MSRFITAKALTRDSFANFGEVIEVSDRNDILKINYGNTARHHELVRVEASDGEVVISIFRSQPVSLPFTVELMERHPLGSQSFMPLSLNSYLVAVAPPGELDAAAIEVFLAAPGQGVNYRRGIWHHYCMALQAESDFLVVDRAGAGDNCDEMRLAEHDKIRVEIAT
jgi:ureidoglycolate lyase